LGLAETNSPDLFGFQPRIQPVVKLVHKRR
jgi:hypothetical protein